MDIDILQKNRLTSKSRIFDLLYKEPSLSKKEIQAKLNLSLPTIKQNISLFEEEGLIRVDGFNSRTGGRSAATYSLVENHRVSVGLDLTRHHITAVVINLYGEVVACLRVRHSFEKSDAYLRYLGEIVDRILEENGIDREKVLGVGIGLPALTNETNDRIVYGKILNFDGMTSEDFGKYVDFPVQIHNDANAACDIELYSTRDSEANGFYIMLSNNVGGAVAINGSVYRGNNFRSGEVGHLKIRPGGLQCYCGQKGCVDPYCSATILTEISDGNLEEFFRMLKEGEGAAVSIWGAYLEHLALAVRNVRILFDCPIILGGYVGAYMDNYLDDLKKILDRYNSFDRNSDYVVACRYKTEAIAAGAALAYVKAYLDQI